MKIKINTDILRNGKIVAVTNRKLCSTDFCEQIEKLCRCGVSAVILREKDLSESDYQVMASGIIRICKSYDTPLMLHTYINAAKRLNHRKIHLPMDIFREYALCGDNYFEVVGVSTHTVEEAMEAERLNASYITASHIYNTDCKPGLQARGIEYLKAVIRNVNIPVYALGGIHMYNMDESLNAGAAKVCMMSELMRY